MARGLLLLVLWRFADVTSGTTVTSAPTPAGSSPTPTPAGSSSSGVSPAPVPETTLAPQRSAQFGGGTTVDCTGADSASNECTLKCSSNNAQDLASGIRFDLTYCNTQMGNIPAAQCTVQCMPGYFWKVPRFLQTYAACTELTRITSDLECSNAAEFISGQTYGTNVVNTATDTSLPPDCFIRPQEAHADQLWRGADGHTGTCDDTNQCLCRDLGYASGTCQSDGDDFQLPMCEVSCASSSFRCAKDFTKRPDAAYISCPGDVCSEALCCVENCHKYMSDTPCSGGMSSKPNARLIPVTSTDPTTKMNTCCEYKGPATCQRSQPIDATTVSITEVCHGREFFMNRQLGNILTNVYKKEWDRVFFYDWDQDGDLDIIVGRRQGVIRLFQRQQGNSFVRVPDAYSPFASITIGNYAVPAIADLDQDGKVDLIVGTRISGIWFCPGPDSVWNPTYTAYQALDNASCTLFIEHDEDGVPVRSAKPALIDYDGDNDLDVFVGRDAPSVVSGRTNYYTILYFENMNGMSGGPGFTSSAVINTTMFVERTAIATSLDIEEVSGAPHVADWDGDYDLDLIVGGASDGSIYYFERLSNGWYSMRLGSSDPFYGLSTGDGKIAFPVVNDWDGDGFNDLLIFGNTPSSEMGNGPTFIKRVPSSATEDMPGTSSPFMGLTFGKSNRPVLANWDNSTDGSMELILGSRGALGTSVGLIHWYYQRWDGSWEMFTEDPTNGGGYFLEVDIDTSSLANNEQYPTPSPCVADWDGDQHLDLIVGTNEPSAGLFYYKRTPGLKYSENANVKAQHLLLQNDSSNPFNLLNAYWNGKGILNPQIVDWDSDGDLDLIVYSHPDGLCYFQYNSGTWASCARIISTTDEDPTTYNQLRFPCVVDWNGDTFPDLFLGTEDGKLRYFVRDAVDTLTELQTSLIVDQNDRNPIIINDAFVDVGANCAPAVADLDGNGALDVIAGSLSGSISVYFQGWCETPEACSLKGLCHPRTGRCQCLVAHQNPTHKDCSACATEYFRLPELQDPAFCQRCPSAAWSPSGSVCSMKGVCDDDATAQALEAATSRSLAVITVGTGNCTCNTYFSGTIMRGMDATKIWNLCSSGECPPGREMLQNATSRLLYCEPCPTGRYKNLAGNGPYEVATPAKPECTDCNAGRYTNLTEQTECTNCESGKYIGIARSSGCWTCMMGTYSIGGAAQCTNCEAGRAGMVSMDDTSSYNYMYGMSECVSCTGGRYSEASSGGSYMCYECQSGKYSGDNAGQCTNCQAGKYTNGSVSSSSCYDCDLGRFQQQAGQSHCQYCDSGKYTPMMGSTGCVTCEPGKQTSTTSGQTNCEDCEEGYFSSANTNYACTFCDPGFYSPRNAVQCTACNAGTFANMAHNCTDCSAGYYSTAAQTECFACMAGRVANSVRTGCDPCPAGEYAAFSASTMCSACFNGTVSTAPESIACTACEPGKHAAEFGGKPNSGCADCEPGKYSGTQAESCTNCPAGTAAAAGAISCYRCDPGQVPTTNSGACDWCQDGHHPSTDQSTCEMCPNGTYRQREDPTNLCLYCEAGSASPPGADSCTDCAAGTYSSTSGASMCANCDAGRYSVAAASACAVCLAGTYSEVGATQCTNCEAGKYSMGIASSCMDCPAGYYAPAQSGACSVCGPGAVSNATAAECHDCEVGKYANLTHCIVCVAGRAAEALSTSCTVCAAGKAAAQGEARCESCQGGTYAPEESGQCLECPAGRASGLESSSCQICSRGQYAEAGAIACSDCQGGTYSALESSTCTDCTAGRYSTAVSGECIVCAAGKSAPAKATQCTDCAGGKAAFAESETCTSCEAGYHAAAGSETCDMCPQGYSAVSEATQCTSCAGGKAALEGSEFCTDCLEGYYAAASAGTCQACAAGTFAPPAEAMCTSCPGGRYSLAGYGECTVCPAGRYAEQGATACLVCQAGRKASNGSSVCEACPLGHAAAQESAFCTQCEAGKYAAPDGGSCIACEKGKAAGNGSTQCTSCEGGKYAAAQSAACSDCAAGTYSSAGAGACNICQVGKFSATAAFACTDCTGGRAASEGSASCTACVAGTSAPGGTASCTECAAGTFSPEGAASCSQCMGGRYSAAAASDCTVCEAGKFARPGAVECLGCQAGRSAKNESTECAACQNGWSAAAESELCTPCDPGKYASADASLCIGCASGKYAGPASTQCTTCEGGRYAAAESSTCFICAAGSSAAAGSATCTECQVGKFSQAGAFACTDCGGGTAAPANSSACTPCTAGTAAPGGTASCTACAAGRFAPAGASQCQQCQGGRVSSEQAEECTACAAGNYPAAGATSCVECGVGKSAAAGALVCSDCAGGRAAPAGSGTCTDCLAGTAAPGGTASCTPCAAGTFAAAKASLCTDCTGGRYSGQGQASCTVCDAGKSAAGGATTCLECAAGKSAPAGQSQCEPCASGFTAPIGQASCTQCAAGKYAAADAGSCLSCERGKAAGAGSLQCTACESGRYALAESASCSPCVGGTFSGAGAGECQACPAGTFSEAAKGQCTACTGGTYSLSNSTSCSNCDAGSVPLIGNTACNPCAAGKYAALGEAVCTNCGGGTHSTEGSTSCEKCPAGSRPAAGAGSCEQCPAGKAAAEGALVCADCAGGEIASAGSASCTVCEAGYFATQGSPSCSSCAPGKYSARKSSACTTCSGGTYSGEAAESCIPCSDGEYSTAGSNACQVCAAGKKSTAQKLNCESCVGGRFASEGSATCTECEAGKFASAGSKECNVCIAGSFSQAGATVCTACSIGTAAQAGSASCTLCKAGESAQAGASECSECGPGKAAPAGSGSCGECKAGTYAAARSETCTDCAGGKSSPGGTADCTVCAAGKRSALAVASASCVNCAAGFYSEEQSTECIQCDPGSFSASGDGKCSDCQAGSFTTDNKNCFPCDGGTISSTKASSCEVCAAGKYSGQGAIVCTPCDPGTQSSAQASFCTACTAGKFSGTGQAECNTCVAGRFSEAGANQCIDCEAGKSATEGSSSCTPCAAGKYSGVAAPQCTDCAAGKYALTGGTDESVCVICPTGRYGPDAARTTFCIPCTEGSDTDGEGKTLLNECLCQPGYQFVLQGDTQFCIRCAAGTYKIGLNHNDCLSCDQVLIGGITATDGQVSPDNCYCQPGQYRLSGGSSVDSCEICPVGFYCLGQGFGSDSRTACPDGATTVQAGSTLASQCLCGPGYYKADTCRTCEEGTFKSYIGDSNIVDKCPNKCTDVSPFSTSGVGSRSNESCYCIAVDNVQYIDLNPTDGILNCEPAPEEAAGEASGETTKEVPAVGGSVCFQGMDYSENPDTLQGVADDIAVSVSQLLGLADPPDCIEVDLLPSDNATADTSTKFTCGDIDLILSNCNPTGTTGNTTGGRRMSQRRKRKLAGGSIQSQYTVRVPTEADAAQKADQFQAAELTEIIKDLDSDFTKNVQTTQALEVPEVKKVETTCPATKAFPDGSAFVSIAVSCQCMAGFETSTAPGAIECDPCRRDFYKQSASSDQCTACDTNRGTFKQGSNSSKFCFCNEGFFAKGSVDTCKECPEKKYCPFDENDGPLTCPEGTETLKTRRSIEDCLCSPGWGLVDGVCEVCSNGTFSDSADNLACRPCPQTFPTMQSPNGSTEVEQCSCMSKYYYSWSLALETGRCERCNIPGVECEGGFYNGTREHVRPYASVDFYLTGVLRAIKCRVDEDQGSYCLGGNESERPCLKDCNCRKGHDGFLCQNCLPGWTRDKYDVICRDCEELGPPWFMITILNMGAIASSLVYIILGSMAAAAGQSTRRVHTALLRLWQSWVLSMVCLKQFDFSEVELFAWSIEQAQAAFLEDNPDADEADEEEFLSNLKIDMPPWFTTMANYVYGLSEFVMQVGSPTETANCLAWAFLPPEKAEDWKHYFHALWWATYPILTLFYTILLSVILVYVLFPPLDKRGWFPPANPEQFRDWAFNLLKPKLRIAIRKLGAQEKDEDEILKEMKVLFGSINFGFRTLEAIAGNPVGGLGALQGRLEDEQKERSKRVLFLIFKPKLKWAFETIAKKLFSRQKRKKGDEPETEEEKKKRDHAFMHPWAEKMQVALFPLLAGMGFDMLTEGLKDPSNLIKALSENEDGHMLAVMTLMPIFRVCGMHRNVDLTTLDEVWLEIEDVLSEVSITGLTTALLEDPTDALESVARLLAGPPGSFVYTLWNKPNIVKFLESEEGGSLEGEELHNAYRKIVFFSGTIPLELLIHWSPREIAAQAMSYSFDGTVSDKYKGVMEEMREEALRIQQDAVLYLAEGASGDIADYPVLGLFHAGPSLKQFFLDARPLLLIALYTMWYETTKQLLLLIHCDPFAVEDDAGMIKMPQRWMRHTNWTCGLSSDKHWLVGIVAYAGLGVWTVGVLLSMSWLVYRNRRQMAQPEVSRLYAYFVQGYEIEYCWWDVLVKRIDLGCTIAITYTNLATDRKAKLLCYTALAASVLMLHAGAVPFDDRKNRLLDRYEYWGLLVRFMTFCVIQLLLVFNPGLYVAIFFCSIVGLAGSVFAFSIWFTILVEYIADITNRGHEATAEDLEELLEAGDQAEEGVSHLTSIAASVTDPAKKCAKCCGKYLCKACLQVLLQILLRVGAFYSHMERKALSIHYGDGQLCLISREEQEQEDHERKFGRNTAPKRSSTRVVKKSGAKVLETFFHQSDSAQREYLATVIGGFYVHVLCTMGEGHLPSHSLECFIVLSAAMKRAKLDAEAQWLRFNVEDKATAMIKGIGDAAKLVRGVNPNAEVDAGDEADAGDEINKAESAYTVVDASEVKVEETASFPVGDERAPISQNSGPDAAQARSAPDDGRGVGVDFDSNQNNLQAGPVGDLEPPPDPMSQEQEEYGVVPPVPDNAPVESTVGSIDGNVESTDLAQPADSSAAQPIGYQQTTADPQMGRMSEVQAAELIVAEEVAAEEAELEEEKLLLHAEELNECLMVMFRMTHERLSEALRKAESAFEGNLEEEEEEEVKEEQEEEAEDGEALDIEISLLEKKISEVVKARIAAGTEGSSL